jgi:EAL domain-containing protein (putative c-di-GMP-specific phosphodiesterase class I)
VIRDPAQHWPQVLTDVLEQPGRVRPHFQPIVDLQRGVVCGYESLARFTDWPGVEPSSVFAAADAHGLGGALEAQMVREVLEARPHVAADRFLSVNLSPAAVLADEVREAFDGVDRLDGVMLEITEQTDTCLVALGAELAGLRARGALVAVDDAGSGYGSLGRITALHPHFVKVDRSLVSNLDNEPAKAAVVETLSDLASRIDAWIVAEGIERIEELDTLIRMRVPLGQGFAFGRPGPGMAELEGDLATHIRSRYRPTQRELQVAALVEAVPTLPEPVSSRALGVLFDRRPGPEHIALVDQHGRPSGIVTRQGHRRREGAVRSLMLVTREMPLAAVSRRAMARPLERRFDPLVCCDEAGRYAGLVRIERIVDALATCVAPEGDGAAPGGEPAAGQTTV